ncbi:MAG TPA: DUF2723 domain-containing protein [Saprospiraceae bacterium]|nr:DUF2723 domain-containing protein [Saprospiraceae bacterium]
MNPFRILSTLTGLVVFAISGLVYFNSVESTGSLWDCGEFILGAYKLQVVHPPGAPVFMLIGRMFTWVAEMISDDPADIAVSINLLSALCSAAAAMLVAWTAMIFGKFSLTGSREAETNLGQNIALVAAGLAAGLATAFSTSIWFSAVEGEVYAMSTFFTALTLWAMVKWYHLPDTPQSDRWVLFAVYSAGLSMGVHLLSLLTFPALAMLYYFKKYKEHNFMGMALAALVGVVFIVGVQSFVIVGIPSLWGAFDIMMVNGLGMPFHSGLVPTILIIGGYIALMTLILQEKITSRTPMFVFSGVMFLFSAICTMGFTEYEGVKFLWLGTLLTLITAFAQDALVQRRRDAQMILMGATLVIVSFSTIGVVVIRANAQTPVNMNAPTDATRLIPYLNREQYGERALVKGPHFMASPDGNKSKYKPRFGPVGDRYELIDEKITYGFKSSDEMLFPRIGDFLSDDRKGLYKAWLGLDPEKPLPPGRPNQADNISFLWNYQINWMYWRYFMWNFAGRQNGTQGYFPSDKANGHWLSGIDALDNGRLYDQSKITKTMREDKSRNRYYMIPFFLGLIGLFYHLLRRPQEGLALLAMFIITGIGIIIYSNQPPNEPRERDYVLVGSFFTFCIWIGMAAPAIYDLLSQKVKLPGIIGGVLSLAVLSAPWLMGTQNFDDHSRKGHTAARDYASNFLNSCEKDAVIFTFGDNDTYPLWYAQEVEGIRTDVRVVNLSLIAVDWYIDLLRRRVGESAPLKFTVPADKVRGSRRNQIPYYNPSRGADQPMSAEDWLRFIALDNPLPTTSGRGFDAYYPSKQIYLPIDREKAIKAGMVTEKDTAVAEFIPLRQPGDYITKDDLAILDIIVSNMYDRPIYFAVTCQPSKFWGLNDYMQLEGLALRIIPVRSESERSYSVVGSGRVDSEKVYKNVMEKFRWGNFDKLDVHVNTSYQPSLQTMLFAMRRAAINFIEIGQPQKAVELMDKYFEVFPHKNFTYDYRSWYMISVYLAAGAYDKAKPHMEILAKETADALAFYESLDPVVLSSSQEFDDRYSLCYRTKGDLLNAARKEKDEAFTKQLEEMFAPFKADEQIPQELPPSIQQQVPQPAPPGTSVPVGGNN